MKLKPLALVLITATFIAAPAFASSDPPTAPFDLRPIVDSVIAKAASIETNELNITPQVGSLDYKYLGAKNAMIVAETASGPPGWSAPASPSATHGAVITHLNGKFYGTLVMAVPSPFPGGDSATKFIGADLDNAANTGRVLLTAAAPPNGFAREDLLGTGGDMGKSALAVDGA